MSGPMIETSRLRLVACDLRLAKAILEDRGKAECLLGARLHPNWPGEDTGDFLPIQVRILEARPAQFMWGLWLMLKVDFEQPLRAFTVIGDLGFKGPPDTEGAVDLGYGIIPEMRRKGYTSEAAKAIIEWAFSYPEVTRITADCDEGNAGSIGVLERLGMKRIGKDRGLILWCLEKPRSPTLSEGQDTR